MIGQSIIKLDRDTLYDRFEEHLLWSADRYYLDTYYKLGEGLPIDKAFYYAKFYDIICTENCSLSKWIGDKIKGKLKDCDPKTKERDFLDMLKEAQKLLKCQSESETVSTCCDWDKIEW